MSSRGQMPETTGMRQLAKPLAVSVLIGAAVCALVLLLMSLLMSVQNIPQFAVDPMAGLALVAGGMAAGFTCAKMMRQNGLACGAICGAVIAVIVMIAGFAIKDNGFGIPALLKIAFIMLSAMLGGVLGVNTGKGRRRQKPAKSERRRK